MPPFNFLAQYLKVLPAFCLTFPLHHFPFCFHIFIIFPYALFLSLFFLYFLHLLFLCYLLFSLILPPFSCSLSLNASLCCPVPLFLPFQYLLLIFNQVPFIPLPSFFKYRHIGYLQAHTEH